jgi:hypothetical protein
MEAVGAASSVIAVIELSAKIAKICLKYSIAVKNAQDDILRLQREVEILQDVLEKANQLRDGQTRQKVPASLLKECLYELQQLETQLEPSKGRKTMRKFGIRALKWPFKSEETDKIIQRLERYKTSVSLTLHLNQKYVMVPLCYWSK